MQERVTLDDDLRRISVVAQRKKERKTRPEINFDFWLGYGPSGAFEKSYRGAQHLCRLLVL